MQKSLWILFLLCHGQCEGGALSRPKSTKPMNFLIFDQFWNKVNDLMSDALQLVGSFLPLRGLASIAKDLGIPYASSILAALTPIKTSVVHPIMTSRSQRRLDTTTYFSLRDEMSSAVGTFLGKGQCQKRLACLSGRHLSHINGASSIALMISTASNFLPPEYHDSFSTMKDSIMYSEDCEQYEC